MKNILSQSLLSVISSVMTDPFAVARPSSLVEATRALGAIMINCWPRIYEGGYAGEVARIISTCWLNVRDSETGERPAEIVMHRLLQELRRSAEMLRSICKAHGDESVLRLDEVERVEPKLQELFAPGR